MLGLLRIRPEIRIGGLLPDLAQLLTQLADVKGTPGVRGLFLSGQRIPVPVDQP